MSHFRVELLADLFPPLLQQVLGEHLDAGKIDFRRLALGRLPTIANGLVSKGCSPTTGNKERSMMREPLVCGLHALVRSCRRLESVSR